MHGSDTEWYKNALKNPAIRIKAGDIEGEFRVVPITDPKQVTSVVEKFRGKYGAGDVKKYYSKLDVAILAQVGLIVHLHDRRVKMSVHSRTERLSQCYWGPRDTGVYQQGHPL